jgi:hypothetical protein
MNQEYVNSTVLPRIDFESYVLERVAISALITMVAEAQ